MAAQAVEYRFTYFTAIMFIEPSHTRNHQYPRAGWIEVICGSMFSGKTEELIRRLTRAKIARQKNKDIQTCFG